MSMSLAGCVFMACVAATIAQCYPGETLRSMGIGAVGCTGVGHGGFGAFPPVVNPSNEIGLGYPSGYPYLGSYPPYYGNSVPPAYPIVYPSLSSYPSVGMGGIIGSSFKGLQASENVNENANTNVNVNGPSFRRGLHLPSDDHLNSNVNFNSNTNADYPRAAMIQDW